jgi:murein DD-endopeptidase MepM/ murein hydrolase activator NlpD
MPPVKYYYNPKTLRYERKTISAVRTALSSFAYISFGVLFFIILILIQNYIIQTPVERSLRTENRALSKHKKILAGQIKSNNLLLSELKTQDNALYNRIFESERIENNAASPDKENILLADDVSFQDWIQTLNTRAAEAIGKARGYSAYFKENGGIQKNDLNVVKSLPVFLPIENFDASKLISGFGKRINPYHKGRYQHDGVDLASPRNSAVLATAPGRVFLTKRSDLLAGYGNYLEIDHGNGYTTRYAHLETISVRTGQTIKKGDVIGRVGMSGGAVAPHVHYEVIKDGQNVDPVPFLIQGVDATQYEMLRVNGSRVNQSLD